MRTTDLLSAAHLVDATSTFASAFVTFRETAPVEATALAKLTVNSFTFVAVTFSILMSAVGSSAPTTVTLEVKVYLLVFPVFFALKLTLIAAGLFSSVAILPRTVTTVPALLFFFPVKFFDFDG